MADDKYFKVKEGLALSANAGSTSEAGSLRRRASDDELVYNSGAGEAVILTEGGVVAADITNTPSGDIAATDVQAAIDELDSEKEPTLTKGNLTEDTSSVLTIGGGTGAVIGAGATIEVAQAGSASAGYLSSADWNTFDGKSDYSDPMTTNGDLVTQAAGVPARLAVGTEGQVLTVSSGAPAWAAATGGGGGGDSSATGIGAKTYFSNYGFETDAGSVSTFDDAGAVYVDGDGGSPTQITVARVTSPSSEWFAGVGSLQVTKAGGSSAQGEGISFAMETIDEVDRGKEMVFAFDLLAGSYDTNELEVHAYDITNSAALDVRRITYNTDPGDTAIPAINGRHKFAIQTSSTTQEMRVSFFAPETAVGGWVCGIDQVQFGPQDPIVVGNISDWQSYTPTINNFGTTTLNYGRYRQVGDTLEISVGFDSGTPTASLGTISLPSGFTANITADDQLVGTWHHQNSGSSNIGFAALIHTDDASVVYFGTTQHNATPSVSLTRTNATFANSSSVIAMNASIPIANASSNVAIGTATTFRMAPILANGTRVTSTPTKLGEYRTYIKNSSATTGTDDAPTAGWGPDALNGMRIDGSKNFSTAGTSGQPGRWEIFVGKNKALKWEFYGGTGRTPSASIDSVVNGTTERVGSIKGYDPSTGVAYIDGMFQNSSVTTRDAGYNLPVSGSAITLLNDLYFDLKISDNVQAIGVETRNIYETIPLSTDVSSTGVMSDFSKTLIVGQTYTVRYQLYVEALTAGEDFNIEFLDGATVVGNSISTHASGTGSGRTNYGGSFNFTASNASFTVNAQTLTAGVDILGDGSRSQTYIQIEKRTDLSEGTI